MLSIELVAILINTVVPRVSLYNCTIWPSG
jgi:hypothetical protein